MLFVIGGRTVNAQQDPQYSHFMFNTLVLNPAVAGSTDALSALILYRNQWVGFEGRPTTQTISGHIPINAINSGVGLHIVNDNLGQESTLGFNAAYALKIKVSKGVLSLGGQLGFLQKKFDPSGFKSIEPNDMSIPTGTDAAILPDIGIGALYSTEKYHIGFSTTHITQGKLTYTSVSGESNFQMTRHFYLTGGYNYNFNSNIDLKPSVILKMDKPSNIPQVEANVIAYYKQRIWAGMAFRFQFDAIIGLVGLNITENIKAGYAYDINVSSLSSYNGNTHELFLGYDLPIKPNTKTNFIIKTPRFL